MHAESAAATAPPDQPSRAPAAINAADIIMRIG